ncbi:LRR receptor kinase SERK2-like isoform X1 [Prosopis cineraria]|uniref:LRR receptor kinase SERK2-like isoform X1 n=1 Tax=Prosopis cineraria TaxID=364024 RepID=UPI00240F9DEF|nr:LRR receptor kinase SERK2-like isoform X1 [Prosopis cineraria]
MKLSGESMASDEGTSDCDGGRTVVVGVKLDPRSRELLTWALVKVAEPGDHVIALHVIGSMPAGTGSLISLVNTFDSVLAVYEGFCNLKQVGLKLKVCRGESSRKLLVREAKSLGASTVILGTSKTHHTIRSSASVAKYCAKKLPKYISVFAVDNGKIAFHREATKIRAIQELNEGPALLHKSFKPCTKTNPRNCESCARVLALPESSATGALPDDQEKNDSLALVPVQKTGGPWYATVVQESNQSKHGWSVLRQVFLPKKHIQKSYVSNPYVFQRVVKQPSWHSSAVVHPDLKQINIDKNDITTLDGQSGAIVPFRSAANSGLSNFHEELSRLQEKYSSSCRVYSFQELASATANFSPDNLVGKGGSSYVYKGCLLDGKVVAVKILKPSEDVFKEFQLEIEIITTLHHENIISLSGFSFDDNNLLLVYDFLSRGSLEENIHGDKKDCNVFGWQERYKVAVGVAEALNFLHNGCAYAVIHRDVKSSNILLSDNFEPQLSDFGLASWGSSSSHVTCTDVAGTFGYLAPEYFMHGRVTDRIDVYAFGVVLLELLSSRKPINNESPKGQESLVMWARPILKDGKLSQLLDSSVGDPQEWLIDRMALAATLCLRRSPKSRPQIDIILKLLHGDEEVTSWAKQEVGAPEELEASDGGLNNIQSHLNLALLDLDDDTASVSSSEQSVSLEDYLQGRWSRSSSFD